MGRRIGFVLKLLAGAYLIFVGVTLLNTILEIRPGNQEVMCGIAAVFILVGAVYLIILVGGVIKRALEERDGSALFRNACPGSVHVPDGSDGPVE